MSQIHVDDLNRKRGLLRLARIELGRAKEGMQTFDFKYAYAALTAATAVLNDLAKEEDMH